MASLETLLNLEAVDKIDPRQRNSPPSRELFVQGIGNVAVGLCGGIPMTSVIIRSWVNINAGGQTKLSSVVHGLLLLVCVMLLPRYLNLIPLSCLAAILLVTGIKLVSPKLIKKMWSEGRYQFVPFIVTLVAIVLTDLLVGIVIGLLISLGFILIATCDVRYGGSSKSIWAATCCISSWPIRSAFSIGGESTRLCARHHVAATCCSTPAAPTTSIRIFSA